MQDRTNKRPTTLKAALESILTKEELKYLIRAYDIVGDIAIMTIPDELVHKEKEIADVLLSLHKNINVVCKRDSIHGGEFRTQKLTILAGEDRKETMHKENRCTLYLNPETCYFSARSGTERKRIASLVRPGEDILVMFSGVCPFPLVISKNSDANEIVAIEKNPDAHAYALKNIKKNKAENIRAICGDVHEVIPTLQRRFDRVIMPLPKTGQDFLELAIDILEPRGTIHFYDFQDADEFSVAVDKIKKICKKKSKDLISVKVVVCGQYAPRVNRICVDAVISKTRKKC